jgi:hypothetical protein
MAVDQAGHDRAAADINFHRAIGTGQIGNWGNRLDVSSIDEQRIRSVTFWIPSAVNQAGIRDIALRLRHLIQSCFFDG